MSSPTATIQRETRTYDASKKKTILLRKKDTDVDYRFMPEPNIPPLVLNEKSLNGKTLDEILQSIPHDIQDFEKQTIIHLTSEKYNLTTDKATLLSTSEHPPSHWCLSLFERAVEVASQELDNKEEDVANIVANWILNDLFKLIKQKKMQQNDDDDYDDEDFTHVTSDSLGQLVSLLLNDTITTPTAKRVLRILHETPNKTPHDIVKERKWGIITNTDELTSLCERVVGSDKYEQQRGLYKTGGAKMERKMEKLFMGMVMKDCQGNAHPDALLEVLRDVLRRL